MKYWSTILLGSLLLGAIAIAGSGTTTPDHKSYKFVKPDPQQTPPDGEVVGHGDFRSGIEEEGENPEGEYMDANPINGSPSTWEQDTDGKYKPWPPPDPKDPPDHRNICFYDEHKDLPEGADYYFEWKPDTVIVYGGWLQD